MSCLEWTADQVFEARGRVRIVDVREPDETSGELGRIREAELVPLQGMAARARRWDRSIPIVLVCRSGARSGRAASLLASMGFNSPINMVGGMIDWNARELPVERG